jgi:hypothetical protein
MKYGGKMKKYLFGIVALIFAAAVIGCSGSAKKGSTPVNTTSDLTIPTVSEMKDGMYLGGGLLYSSTNPAYNHFNGFHEIPVRLSKLKQTTKNGEVIVKTYNPDTGALVSQTTTNSMGATEEIADSVLVGKIGIKSIDDNAVTILYKILNDSGETAYTSESTNIPLGTKVDINGDGVSDLEYSELDPENLGGLKGVKVLRFLSDESALTVTMYQAPSDTTYKYPSGILAVNPSDNFIFKLSSMTYLEGADITKNGKNYRQLTFESGSAAAVMRYNFIFDDAAAKMYMVALAPETKDGKTTLYCSLYDTFMAFEHANFKYSGSAEKLMAGKNRLLSSADGISENEKSYLKKIILSIADVLQKAFEIPLTAPTLSWSNQFYRNGSDYLTASFGNSNSLYVDADYGFHGSSVSVRCKILFKGNFSMLLEGRVSGSSESSSTYGGSVSHQIDSLIIPVTIGPVFVGNFVLPVEFGADASVTGYGTIRSGATLSGQFGFSSEVGVGVKYRRIKIGFIKISIPYGIEFIADADRICDVSVEKVNDIAFRGRASFTPYMKMGGGFRLFGIAGCDIYTKASFNNELESSLEYGNSSNLSVNYKLNGDLSIGAQFVAELRIWEFGGSVTKGLGQISVWNKEIFNKTYSVGGGSNPYNIKYNANGGSGAVPPLSVYLRGETVAMPANTTGLSKTNFALKGWKINNQGSTYTAGETFSMPAADITMYADWVELPKYTVSYDLNGGTGRIPSSAVYYQGAEVQAVDIASYDIQRTAWKFLGWSTSSYGSSLTNKFNIYANTTLYAVWEKKPEHRVIYDGNGMTSGSLPASESKYEGQEFYPQSPDSASIPQKTGFFWGGWSESPNGVRIDSATMGSSDKTLYVYWSANPSFSAKFYLFDTCLPEDLKGNYTLQSGVNTIPQQVDNQQNIIDSRRINDGYDFAGWKCVTDANYSGGSTMPAKDLVFVAQWTKMQRYSFIYYSAGGSGTPVGTTVTDSWIGKTIYVPIETPVKYHYAFVSWVDNLGITHASGSSFQYTNGALTSMTAVWSYVKGQHRLIYDGNGGTSNSATTIADNDLKEEGSAVLLATGSNNFVRANYYFIGWSSVRDGEPVTNLTMPDSDMTVYAIWGLLPQVQYFGNGSTIGTAPASYPVMPSTVITIAPKGDLIRDDDTHFYSFAGWNTSSDGKGVWYQPGDILTIGTENVLLYAIWIAEGKYWVEYMRDYSRTMTSPNVESRFAYREGERVPPADNLFGFIPDTESFCGWLGVTSSGGSINGNGYFFMPAENVIMYSQWDRGTDSGNRLE